MDWKKMTIGKKITLGFGCILMLLSLVCVLSLTGVNGIVTNASEVIEGNKLDSNLAQKEVDHLNWAGKVNAMLTDDKVTTLDVQTDHRNCKCGRWLYGEGRKHAEALVPSLAPLLKSLEEPHRILHESAIEIEQVFKQPHSGLNLTLSNRLTDHINWVEQLGRAIASEAGGLYSYQNMLKASLDQAMASIRNNDVDAEGDLKTRQNHVMHIIEELRYGNQDKGYFFIIDDQTRMVMHPMMPELVGKDVSDKADPTGKRLFTDMVRLCREKEEGFVVYQWPLPGSNRLAPKLTYVKQYKPWGWIVGSGIYIDHTNTALVKRAEKFAAGTPFSVGIQTDPGRCAFGHFLTSPETKALESTFPELRAALEAIIAPHNRLHESAIRIEEMINELDMQGAMRILNSDTQEALTQVKAHFQKAIEAEHRLQEGMDKANKIYTNKTTPALKDVQRVLGEIRQETKRHIMTDDAMLRAAQTTELSVTLISIVAVIFGVLLAYFIARGIIKVLKHIAMQMDEGSGQVASAAAQVSSASYQLAEGTSEQAASLEETSSSLEEISSMTRQNAQNAQQADDLMQESNQVILKANDAMGDLTDSMQEISQASDETSKIIKTIDEIAFQTNLLALNAAVEAARAGEAGAGFAVVADEVRNLALRAADAARNTATLIEGSVKKIGNGSDIVTRTNDAFSQVADSSKKVGGLVREISHASQEQSEGIGQINKAMLEMDNVTQQNAANAEESSSAAEQMNAQAQHMKMLSAELRALVDGTASHDENDGAPALSTPIPKVRKTEKMNKKTPDHSAPKAIPMADDFHDF